MWWIPIFWTAPIPAAPLVLTSNDVWVAFVGLLLAASALGLWCERDQKGKVGAGDATREVPEGAAGCAA